MSSGPAKTRTIAQLRALVVRPAYLRGDLARVEVHVCTTCTAVVFDPVAHDKWHTAQDRGSE